jgi:hypothetical protein
MNKKIILVLMLSFGFGIAACNRADVSNSSVDNALSIDEARSDKVLAYISLGSQLHDQMLDDLLLYADDDDKAQKGDFKAIRSDGRSPGYSDIQGIKDIIAMPGITPELDKAANELLALLNIYVPNWNNLKEYNAAKQYQDDNGVKGKAMLPKYLEGIEKIKASITTLEAEINRASALEISKITAHYKARSSLSEVHMWDAIGSAQKLRSLFLNDNDFEDAVKIKQADAYVASIEASLEAAKLETDKPMASEGSVSERYDIPRSRLIDMLGNYRDARKDPSKFKDVVSAYGFVIATSVMIYQSDKRLGASE